MHHKRPDKVRVIILAAGQGTRLKSNYPKVLHKVGGLSLLRHSLRAALSLKPEKIILVTSPHKAEIQAEALKETSHLEVVVQPTQQGTGHAVLCARPYFEGFSGKVFVLFADTPFIQPETLQEMSDALTPEKVGMVVVGMQCFHENQYGRLVLTSARHLERIVEYKEATAEEREISFCNSGLMGFKGKTLTELLPQLKPSSITEEYYLTDLVTLANKSGYKVAVCEADEREVQGINSRHDLAQAENFFQEILREKALEQGVTLIEPQTVHLSYDTTFGRDTIIEPYVFIGPGVTLGEDVTIHAFSHLEGVILKDHTKVGPFARLRPGTVLEPHAKVGNFVEVKNTHLSSQVKVNHLSYIGDAFVGEGSNIGAGTITCNYDGISKHKTHIGQGVFVGSNSTLVAPLRLEDHSFVAAGSTLTKDVSAEALAFARPPQVVKENGARRLRERQKKKVS